VQGKNKLPTRFFNGHPTKEKKKNKREVGKFIKVTNGTGASTKYETRKQREDIHPSFLQTHAEKREGCVIEGRAKKLGGWTRKKKVQATKSSYSDSTNKRAGRAFMQDIRIPTTTSSKSRTQLGFDEKQNRSATWLSTGVGRTLRQKPKTTKIADKSQCRKRDVRRWKIGF